VISEHKKIWNKIRFLARESILFYLKVTQGLFHIHVPFHMGPCIQVNVKTEDYINPARLISPKAKLFFARSSNIDNPSAKRLPNFDNPGVRIIERCRDYTFIPKFAKILMQPDAHLNLQRFCDTERYRITANQSRYCY